MDVPLMVSRRTLARRRRLPRACADWALDSGGFSELTLYGGWTVTARQYAAEVRRFATEIGRLTWAAAMDWMTEPFVTARTGLSITEHQRRTVENYCELLSLAPDLPWTPVLQGQREEDYLCHLDAYDQAGFDLRKSPVVGLGSVCRRQGTTEVLRIIRRLTSLGVKLHGFGMKLQGLAKSWGLLCSADSLAWSFAARRGAVLLPGHRHRACNNCPEYALRWRAHLLEHCQLAASTRASCGEQLELFGSLA
jgi:hypothetical protein